MQPLLFNDPAQGIRRPHDCAWLVSLSYILQFSLYFNLQNILFTPSDRRNDDESTSSSTSSTEEYFTPAESASKPSTSYFATPARVALGRSSLSTSSGKTDAHLRRLLHVAWVCSHMVTDLPCPQLSSKHPGPALRDRLDSGSPLRTTDNIRGIHPPLPIRELALKGTESKLAHQPFAMALT